MPKETITIRSIITKIEKKSPDQAEHEYLGNLSALLLNLENGKLRIVSPVCANYRTIKINGKRIPLIHSDPRELISGFVPTEKMRRGAALFTQEIPELLSLLLTSDQVSSIQHLVILVDYGMSPTLWGKRAQEYHQKSESELKQSAQEAAKLNAMTLQELESWGISQLQTGPGEPNIEVKVMTLSEIVGLLDNSELFDQLWKQIYLLMKDNLDLQNDRVAAMTRRALKEDSRYLRIAWGIRDNGLIEQRTIRDNFALTAIFARLLPQLYAAAWNEKPVPRNELLMVDTIPGPSNPGHKEFDMYNASSPLIDREVGQEKAPLTILRPFHNLVLLYQLAVESPWISMPLNQALTEILTAIENSTLTLPQK